MCNEFKIKKDISVQCNLWKKVRFRISRFYFSCYHGCIKVIIFVFNTSKSTLINFRLNTFFDISLILLGMCLSTFEAMEVWYGPVVLWTRCPSFLVNGTYVDVFPLAGHSSGIDRVLIDICKNLWYFLGILLSKQLGGGGGGDSIEAVSFVCLQPTKLLFGSTGCDRYCSNWDFHCFFVVNNTGEPTV